MSAPAPDFITASSVLRTMPPPGAEASSASTSTLDLPPPQAKPTTGTSHRNASNAHLPVENAADGGEEGIAGPSKPVNKPVNVPAGNKRSIIVNACQRGNPLLNGIKGIGWEYGDIVPDYQVGQNTCVLYLSLKYHRLHPEYLHNRIERLRGMYLLRVLLLICDISEHQEPIREITKICLINDMTVMTAWNVQEAATYIMTYKAFEHKPPDMLKERVQKDYPSQLQNVLTSVKGVNKTDVITLSTNFGSFKKLAHATQEQLSLCPGLGDVKVRRLMDAFNLPFRPGAGSAKGKKPGSDFFKKADGQVSSDIAGGAEGETNLGKRKRPSTVNGEVIDIDLQDDDIEMLPTPKKRLEHASPEWEASDTEEPPVAPERSVQASPEWETSDQEDSNQAADGELEANGMLSAPWKDPLDSDSEDDTGEPVMKQAKT